MVLVIEETELDVVTSAPGAEEAVVASAIVAFGMYAVVTSGNKTSAIVMKFSIRYRFRVSFGTINRE